MPLHDLQAYRAYTERRRPPSRRIEMLLAQISMLLARFNGMQGVSLSDFLLDPVEPETPEQRRAALEDFFRD